ncbi:MAG: hypothetical protein H7Z41_04070 [Cytophagales bacterium]|nr:hypothetical protein [Armatimonadota bacterium]
MLPAGPSKPPPTGSTNVVFSHNLHWGGNVAPTLGEGDRIADPAFVNPSRDPKAANFRLKPGSPALGAGISLPFSPFLNLDGKSRGDKPDRGAY